LGFIRNTKAYLSPISNTLHVTNPVLKKKKLDALFKRKLNISTSYRNNEYKDSILLKESEGLPVCGSTHKELGSHHSMLTSKKLFNKLKNQQLFLYL